MAVDPSTNNTKSWRTSSISVNTCVDDRMGMMGCAILTFSYFQKFLQLISPAQPVFGFWPLLLPPVEYLQQVSIECGQREIAPADLLCLSYTSRWEVG